MRKYLLITLLAASLPALADRLPLPADTPASYRSECGSCHLAYPPALLSAADWRRTLEKLAQHFGSDAQPEAAQFKEIAAFLERNAGTSGRSSGAGNPPRITKTARFLHKHDEIPARYWRDARVGSAANCEACHRDAAKGRFSEHDILIPELRR